MKLNYLSIVGFQGIKSLTIDKPPPVIVITGPNATGKSTVRDAIQFALDGGSGRCKLIKDYAIQLVNDDSDKKSAMVSMQLGDIEFQRKVATGVVTTDAQPDFPALLPWLIGTEQLSDSDTKTMQRIITFASGLKVKPEDIKEKLLGLGASEACVGIIMPYLRSGFAAGLKEAKNKLTGKRGEWKGITGETYGVEKAKNWRPESINVKVQVAEIAEQIKGLEKLKASQAKKRDGFGQGGDPSSHNYTDIGKCPTCDAELSMSLGAGRKLFVRDRSEEVVKPDTSRSVESYQSLDRIVQSTDQAIGRERGRIEEVKRADARREEKADAAARVNNEFIEWKKLAELLSPDGLPRQLIEAALKPINLRMMEGSITTGWPVTVISPDLRVIYGGRLLGLCSDSEQWRANAVVAEALSYVSGIGMFVLDRMDILEPKDRAKFIRWIDAIKDEHDTIIVMATLKSPPPPIYGFESIWLGTKPTTQTRMQK